MLMFSGFNGFGQFGSELGKKTLMFKEFKALEKVEPNENFLISPSWSYTAFATGQRLSLVGFLSQQPQAVLNIVSSARIKQICATDKFCLVLLENGRLQKLLPQMDAKLQEIKFAASETLHPPLKRSIFGTSKCMDDVHITHIACGTNISVAYDSLNVVYSIPSRIHQFPKHFRLKQLLCGFEHALLLSCNGDLYSWGNGLRGQLGQEVLRVEESPMLVEALAGVKITHIAAAGWHSAAISAFGDLYTWGFNSHGQLGLRLFKVDGSEELKQPKIYTLPELTDVPKCCTPVEKESEECDSCFTSSEACTPLKVVVGARHSVLQMSCGKLWVVGWNAHGQLALEQDKECFDSFQPVKLPEITSTLEQKNLEVICGAWCTILKES